MQILVISNRAVFFLDIFRIGQKLAPEFLVEHKSLEEWERTDLASVQNGTWLILDAEVASSLDLLDAQPSSSDKPYAIMKCVKNDSGLRVSEWESLSRDILTLRIRGIGMMIQPEQQIRETVVLESEYLRGTEFVIPTQTRFIPVIRNRLLQSIPDFEIASDSASNHFCMALEEALANAFYHGNLELCSSLKEDGSSRFLEMAAEREDRDPWKSRVVTIHELAGRPGLWLTITDQGRGFDVEAAFERANDPEQILASGRGLMMMQAFSDELFFNKPGNQVTMVLYSRAANRTEPIQQSAIYKPCS
ncbi:MAG: ATP-binding protein [Planctomycetaceae bacterium]|nr:ATP-binding protein [Planctomycetaceae bacterium]